MADRQPECIIVSSDRYNDLEPYCSYIYNHDPQQWDSIFPWEFPQNGTKDEEEQFLRCFFSETETHMQGFRFLKQVWYSIALFNLYQRVPAFTNWWLAKPSSIELLNDTKLQPFLFRQDVTPSTFFSDELAQYGEKFLSMVIPYLQQAVKELLEKRELQKDADPTCDDNIATQQASRKVSDNDAPTTGQSVDSKGYIVRTTVSMPSPMDAPESSVAEAPQSAPPLMSAIETARPHVQVPSVEPPVHQDIQYHPRKRGNSFNSANRRSNHRGGGNFSTRPATSFSERNKQMYQSPVYGPAPMMMHSHPRVPSGGSIDFVPAQGQPLQPLPHHMQYMPNQVGQPNAIQQLPVPPNVHFTPAGQHPYFGHAFGDRSNTQLHDHGFNIERHMQYIQDPSNFRGAHRRNSQGARGGRPPRGNFGNRGKNSRARNSFSSVDQPPFSVHGESMNSKPFGELQANAYPHKNRRGSVIHETNWRSGSDNPQIQQHELMRKENMVPNQAFRGSVHYPSMQFMPQNQHVASVGLPPGVNGPRPSTGQAPAFRNIAQTQPRARPPHSVIDPRNLTPDQACGSNWIGENCTYVDTLLVLDVPHWIDDDKFQDFFSTIANVETVSRSLSSWSEKPDGPHHILWVTFANAAEARKFLANKPPLWLGDKLLRVEVPRRYWDSSHTKYYFKPREDTVRPPGESKPTIQIPSILRRSAESPPTTRDTSVERPITDETKSTDVTPTPSGASTPNKKKKNNSSSKKNKNKKKEKEDLRKTSLTANADQLGRSQNAEIQGEADAALTISDRERDGNPESIGNGNSMLLDTSRAEAQRSASVQTEIQTTSEPAFSSTDIVETGLPILQSVCSQHSSDELLQPGSAQTEIQSTLELAFTPTEVITTRLPQDLQPFRSEEETAKAMSQATGMNDELACSPTDDIKYFWPRDFTSSHTEKKVARKTQDTRVDEPETQNVQDVNEISQAVLTPCKSDDDPVEESFHTASGSPDSDKTASIMNKCDSARSETITTSMQDATEQVKLEVCGKSETIVTPASPESTVSPKTNKRVQIPRLPTRSRLESTSSSSTTKPDTLEPPQLSNPTIGPAPPTPSYFTAPNTPAVPQESPEEEGEAQDEEVQPEPKPAPQPVKKTDKAKGPAQTESFSLFGKKKEKKPKNGRKGTLKGKPNADSTATSDVASGCSSRVVSGATTPNFEPPAKDVQVSADSMKGCEEMTRTNSKPLDRSTETPKTSQDSEKNTADDLIAVPAPQQETPSKRKGLGGLLSSFGLFSGGQQSLSFAKSDHALPSKNALTGAKAQDRPPERGIKKPNETSKNDVSTVRPGKATTTGQVKDPNSGTVDNLINPMYDGKGISISGSRGGLELHTSTTEVGLGISDAGEEPDADGDVKSKKKPKKKKRSKKQVAEGSKDGQSSTPVSESKTTSWMFRFGKESGERSVEKTTSDHLMATPAPVFGPVAPPDMQHAVTPLDEQGDETELEAGADGSEASSHTISLASGTPTSELQSPTLSGPGKKFLSKPPGQAHLMEAKAPKWKQKKRIVTPRKAGTPPESEADADTDENTLFYVERKSENDSPSGKFEPPKRPEKLYVYIGKGAREDVDGVEVMPSKEKLKELASEELLKRNTESALQEQQHVSD